MAVDYHQTQMLYPDTVIRMMFNYAKARDVEKGGCYDTRTAAINIWSHCWTDFTSKAASEITGTFYFHWGGDCDDGDLWNIQVDPPSTFEDLELALGMLEREALGRVIYGRLK